MPIGKVWLVGAGAGEPGLLTLRGQEVLENADVVLYDALSHPALLGMCGRAELRNVGKRFGKPSPTQEWITSQLVELALLGKRVVRLKGGDPLLFARGAEEVLALRAAGVPFEIVPGIPSPVAMSAYAGIPLTHRTLSSSVTFITGSDRLGIEWSPQAWEKLATATDTLCVLMGMRRIEEITAALLAGGRSSETPAAVVQWAARPNQRCVVATLGNIAERARAGHLSNPALIIVGEVVALREEIRWFDQAPLFGKNVLVLRPEQQATETAAAVRARAASPVTFPAISVVRVADTTRVARAVAELASYQWVVFTSANGVRYFFDELRALGRDARAFASARLAAIGPKTAESLQAFGLQADLVAKEYVAESLVQALLATGALGRVLIPRALEARDVLPVKLSEAGAHVDVVAVYVTEPAPAARAAELRQLLEQGALDVALFTSGSTVDAVVALLGNDSARLLASLKVASIGPITSQALAKHGIFVDVAAATHTLDGLLDAVEAVYLAERASSAKTGA